MTAITKTYRSLNLNTAAAERYDRGLEQLMKQPPLSAREQAAFRKELGR